MRGTLAALILLASPAAAWAQRLDYQPVGDDSLASTPRLPYRTVEGDSEPARPATGSAAGPGEGGKLLRWALLDRLEYGAQSGQDAYSWDLSALLGGERNRLWLASVGEGSAFAAPDYLEFHALYSRYVGGNFDLNFGVRWDATPRPRRAYATLGGQYDDDKLWVGGFGYVSHEGEVGARLAALYNYNIVGPLFLQPSGEIDWIGEDVPALGLGRGFYYGEAGLRLRYEADERFAPYVGVSWERSLGRTAKLEREAGEDPESTSLVLGVRSAF